MPEGTTPSGECAVNTLSTVASCCNHVHQLLPGAQHASACLIARQSITHFCPAAGPSPPAPSGEDCAAGSHSRVVTRQGCVAIANSAGRPHNKLSLFAVLVTLYNQGDSTSAYDIDATISVPNDCMCHDISQSGTSGVSFSAPPGATVTLYKGFGCQPSAALLAENNAQCFNGNHELPSTDSTCDSFSASTLQASSLDDGLHSIMICSGKPVHTVGADTVMPATCPVHG